MPSTASAPVQSSPAIRIDIETRGGHTYRYHAKELTLAMRRGAVRVVEKEYGCFIFLDRCDLAVTDAQGNTLFHLNQGRMPDDGANLLIAADETTEP